jgi:arylsulfatase A-like enzyme
MPEKVKEIPKKPNLLVIWGDDIGISHLNCHTLGLMGFKTPKRRSSGQRGQDLHRFLRQITKMLTVHLMCRQACR